MGKPQATWGGDIPAIYDRSFARMCAGAIPEILSHSRGETLIDAGCGTGLLSQAAADAGWSVLAFDDNPLMVSAATTRHSGRKDARTIRVVTDSLPDLKETTGWQGDTVVANFVIQHVPNPLASIASLAALLTPQTDGNRGGVLIITSWPPIWLPHRAVAFDVMDDVEGAPHPRSPQVDAVDTSPSGLATLVKAAGLYVSVATHIHWDWSVHWKDYWAGVEAGIAPLGRRYRAQRPELRPVITRKVREKMARYGAPGNMTIPCTATLCVAERSTSLL